MEISYTTFQNTQSNTYITIPIQIVSCCPDSLKWMIGKVCDIAIPTSTILVQNDPTKVADYYNHCQFCGRRHVCNEFVSVVDENTGEARYEPREKNKGEREKKEDINKV